LSVLALSGLPIALNDVMEMSIELEATDLYHCGAARADQWRSTQVDLSNMRVHANNQNKTCAQKTDDNDLQVRIAVSAVQRMIHSRLRFPE